MKRIVILLAFCMASAAAAGPSFSVHGSIARYAMGDVSDYLDGYVEDREPFFESISANPPHFGYSGGVELGWCVAPHAEATFRFDAFYTDGEVDEETRTLKVTAYGVAVGGAVRGFLRAGKFSPYGLLGAEGILAAKYDFDGLPRAISIKNTHQSFFAGVGGEYRLTGGLAAALEGGYRFASVPLDVELFGFGLPQDFETLDFGGPFLTLRVVYRPLDNLAPPPPPRYHW